MMNPSGKQAAIKRLLYELASAVREYRTCIRNDETFEVKKKVRMRLKEIEKEIGELDRRTDAFFVPDISPGRMQPDLNSSSC